MIWLKGDEHFIQEKNGRYTVTKYTRSDGKTLYEAWARPLKKSLRGEPAIMPECLGHFESCVRAQGECEIHAYGQANAKAAAVTV